MKVSEVIEEIGLIDEINGMCMDALSCQKNHEMVSVPTDYIIDIKDLLSRYKCMILDKEIK